jgi:hypothetical protein
LAAELGVTEITNGVDGEGWFTCFTPMSGEEDGDVWGEAELVMYLDVDVLMSYFFIGDCY